MSREQAAATCIEVRDHPGCVADSDRSADFVRDFIAVAPAWERLHIACRRKEPPLSLRRFNRFRDIAPPGNAGRFVPLRDAGTTMRTLSVRLDHHTDAILTAYCERHRLTQTDALKTKRAGNQRAI